MSVLFRGDADMKISVLNIVLGACMAMAVLSGCHRDKNLYSNDTDELQIKEESSVAGLPNPFTKVFSVAEAEAALGRKIPQLGHVPEVYEQTPEIFMMNENEMAQFMYSTSDGSDRMLYRVSVKLPAELLNGDYNQYAINRHVAINNRQVFVKGNGDGSGYYTAEWSVGDMNFCILSSYPLTEKDLAVMIR